MGSVHNDLHLWAAKARGQGQSTIEIDIETANRAAEKIVELSNRVMDLEHSLRARSSAPEAREEALGNLLAVIHGDGGHRALEVGTKQAALEAEKIVADLLSSAPEAREGEAVAWLMHQTNGVHSYACITPCADYYVEEGRFTKEPLYTHPAAPSADKLRIAVEALGLTKSRIQTWPIDDQETCMCGSPVSGHGMGDGHSPVSQGDHAVSMLVEEIDQALAALKAEIAK